MKRHQKILAIAGCLFVVSTIVVLYVCLAPLPVFRSAIRDATVVTNPANVASIRASIFGSPQIGFKEIREFNVPPDHIQDVMFWLTPSGFERNYRPWPEEPVGRLYLTRKDGDTVEVLLYSTGKNPVAYSINDVRFYFGRPTDSGGNIRDGSVCVYRAIAEASDAKLGRE